MGQSTWAVILLLYIFLIFFSLLVLCAINFFKGFYSLSCSSITPFFFIFFQVKLILKLNSFYARYSYCCIHCLVLLDDMGHGMDFLYFGAVFFLILFSCVQSQSAGNKGCNSRQWAWQDNITLCSGCSSLYWSWEIFLESTSKQRVFEVLLNEHQ